MAWSEWKKFGASHVVIPLYCTHLSNSTTFDRTFPNIWTNDTGKDVTLYFKGSIGVFGNGSSIIARFKTSAGTKLYDVTSYDAQEFNFTVPNGATLEMLSVRNLTMGGALIDYDFISNQVLED